MNNLIIMRGLPGAGKSTFVRETYPEAKVCSADFFFEKLEHFDAKLLGEAHAECFESARYFIHHNYPLVVIDNTNIQKKEYQRYVTLGELAGYTVTIVNLYDGGCSDEELAARNVHNITIETIARRRAQF